MKPADVPLERVSSYKVLGVTITEKFSRKSLSISKTPGIFETIYSIYQKKNLAKALVLSKLGYANVFFYNIPKYLQNHTQGVQNATASFLHCKYAKEDDVLTLNWLPLRKDIPFFRSSFPWQK